MPARFRLAILASLVALLPAVPTAVARADSRPKPAIATYDKLLEYLDLGVKEEKLLGMLAESPVTFTLSTAQVEKLRTAGASDRLLAALTRKPARVAAGSDVTSFVLILDCSGSMTDRTPDGGTKWEAARKAVLDLLASIPDGREVALIVYGHDAARECSAVDVLRPLSPIEPEDRGPLARKIRALSPQGHTPIARALKLAGKELATARGMARVILLTDGMETCHGDPNAEAAALKARHKTLKGVDVIGLGLNEKEGRAVAGIAESGSGTYFDAKTVEKLAESVKTLEREIAKPEEDEPEPELTALEARLVEQLKDRDRDVRTEAARALGKRGSKGVVYHLKRRVQDDNYSAGALEGGDPSKDAAFEAVLKLAPEKAAGVITPMLTHKERRVREWAANLIARHKVEGAVGGLVRRVADGVWSAGALEGSDPSKDAALKALKELAPDKVEDALARAMKSSDKGVKAWAAKKIAE